MNSAAPLSVAEIAAIAGTTPATVRGALGALGIMAQPAHVPELVIHPGLVPLALGMTPGQWQRAQVDHAIRQVSGSGAPARPRPPYQPRPALALAPPIPIAAEALPASTNLPGPCRKATVSAIDFASWQGMRA